MDDKKKRQSYWLRSDKERSSEFNAKPWDLNKKKIIFSEVFDLLIKNSQGKVGDKTLSNYISKYKSYCKDLYDLPYCDLRTYHFTEIINASRQNNGSKNNLRL